MAVLLLLLRLLKKFLKSKPKMAVSFMLFMKGDMSMKESKTLRMSFVDEGGNPWSLNILNPRDGLKREAAQSVADTITTNNLVNGKMGQVKTYNGATIITRTEGTL